MNLQTRSAYQEDCQAAVDKWNRVVADLGVKFRLPSSASTGMSVPLPAYSSTPRGRRSANRSSAIASGEWLPSDDDEAYVKSLMTRAVTEPGKFASWIAPPARGINSRPADFEYVRFNAA